ncbi:MAG: HNH endonuclease [Syntrophomonadaceae bacterium]|nr:HNH endonuclease [Syntrophomonadaceae bacterium]
MRHNNGDKHDNRIANLRTATPQQNQANKRRNKGKSTPKGVRLLPSGLYQSRITINGKQLSLGSFRTHQDASAEYMRVAKSHYGQYARAD